MVRQINFPADDRTTGGRGSSHKGAGRGSGSGRDAPKPKGSSPKPGPKSSSSATPKDGSKTPAGPPGRGAGLIKFTLSQSFLLREAPFYVGHVKAVLEHLVYPTSLAALSVKQLKSIKTWASQPAKERGVLTDGVTSWIRSALPNAEVSNTVTKAPESSMPAPAPTPPKVSKADKSSSGRAAGAALTRSRLRERATQADPTSHLDMGSTEEAAAMDEANDDFWF